MQWPIVHPAGIALHVVRRSRARTACFFGESDRLEFLGGLREYAVQYACAVHAYVLMGNHVHLLLTASDCEGTAGLMAALYARHARFVNEMQKNAGEGPPACPGSLWDEGFEASPVRARNHLLACMRYIELNPVRAGFVSSPDAYRWSSYRANALGRADDLIAPHPLYFALGRSTVERQAAYLRLFRAKPLSRHH